MRNLRIRRPAGRARPAVLIALLMMGGAAFAAAPSAALADTPPGFTYVCGQPTAGTATCMAMVPSGEMAGPGDTGPSGFGATDLESAYGLPALTSAGPTVAVVDLYDDPNAEADLGRYRAQYGLPPCTTANDCFIKVNQNGAASPLPAGNQEQAVETSLDLDMVSAGCPQCRILLVEANDSSFASALAAEDTATSRARYVTNSWSVPEFPGETSYDSHFNRPGVAITFATGDAGTGATYPSVSPYVTAVGGTSLQQASGTARGWSETAWQLAGSGCSAYEPRPSWQSTSVTGCGGRATADVSAVADPRDPVAVADSYGFPNGWIKAGGTSAASPLIAAVYALAGPPAAADNPAWYPWARPASGRLNDVLSGSNGSCGTPLCTARTGWDGPTGLGTPSGIGAFSVPTTVMPSVLGLSQATATSEISSAGLTVSVSTNNDCVNPGDVENQNPTGGTRVELNYPAHITVSACTSGGGTGGGGSTGSGGGHGGGGGGSGGHPILPK